MNYRYAVGGSLLVAGVVLAGLQLSRYFWWTGSDLGLFFNTLPFLWICIAIVYVGYRLVTTDEYVGHEGRIAGFGVGGGAAFGAVLVLVFAGTDILGGAVLLFSILDAATAGVLAGLLVGIYDATNRETLAEIETTAEKLEGLNQYGKLLNQSVDVDGVSALCIEVAEFVIRADGAAFLRSADDDFEVVDSTLPDRYDPNFLANTARGVAECDGLTVVGDGARAGDSGNDELDPTDGATDDVSTDDAVRSLDDATEPIWVIPIPAGDVTAVLVLRVRADTGTAPEKDVHMLELLAAHASTALSRMPDPESEQSLA